MHLDTIIILAATKLYYSYTQPFRTAHSVWTVPFSPCTLRSGHQGVKHAKDGLCHICGGTVLESRSAISLVQRSPCLRRRVAACPVLHVQLETSQRDATLAVVQHLHRSARAAGRPVVRRHAVIMELSHHGFSTVNISGVGRPTASVEKCHFVVVVHSRHRCRRRRSIEAGRRRRRSTLHP